MRQELRRYAIELGLCLLMIGAVVSGVIVTRYRSYQGEMERMALILSSDETEQDVFRILKGDEEISENGADEILDRYGYTDPEDSEAGRQFLRDCTSVLAGGAFAWICFAGILGFEQYRKKRKARSRARILSKNWRRYGKENTGSSYRNWMHMWRTRAGKGFWTNWIPSGAMWI